MVDFDHGASSVSVHEPILKGNTGNCKPGLWPDREGYFQNAAILEREEAGGRVKPPLPIPVINKVDFVAGCNPPAQPGVPAQLPGDIVVLDVVHETQVRGKEKIGFELIDVLVEISLGQPAADEVDLDRQIGVSAHLDRQAEAALVQVARIESAEGGTGVQEGETMASRGERGR